MRLLLYFTQFNVMLLNITLDRHLDLKAQLLALAVTNQS